QDVCHILRDRRMQSSYYGPRFLVRIASLEMHPLDTLDRLDTVVDDGGLGLCNITKCCTEVCPEGIHITDNAIIPLKERVADRYYDPVQILWRKLRGGDTPAAGTAPIPPLEGAPAPAPTPAPVTGEPAAEPEPTPAFEPGSVPARPAARPKTRSKKARAADAPVSDGGGS
ncbi:MAG: hypothetical protein ACJ765_02435, partial [Chloroflexota bacterium]